MAKFEIPCIISWEFLRDLYRIFHRSSQRISELPLSNSAHLREFDHFGFRTPGMTWTLITYIASVCSGSIPSVWCLNFLSAVLVLQDTGWESQGICNKDSLANL